MEYFFRGLDPCFLQCLYPWLFIRGTLVILILYLCRWIWPFVSVMSLLLCFRPLLLRWFFSWKAFCPSHQISGSSFLEIRFGGIDSCSLCEHSRSYLAFSSRENSGIQMKNLPLNPQICCHLFHGPFLPYFYHHLQGKVCLRSVRRVCLHLLFLSEIIPSIRFFFEDPLSEFFWLVFLFHLIRKPRLVTQVQFLLTPQLVWG